MLWKSKLAGRPEMGLEQRPSVSADTQKTYDHCLELYEGESHNKDMRLLSISLGTESGICSQNTNHMMLIRDLVLNEGPLGTR